jgi:hypothetical protein
MHRVILTGTPAQLEALGQTILTRGDIEPVRIGSIGQSIQELFIRPCQLWVAHDDPGVDLPKLLEELYRQYPSSNLSIIVLTNDPGRFARRDYVKLVSRPEFDVSAVNEAVATALNLPLRRGVRLPIRLGIKLEKDQSVGLATTVTVSPVGMLVETLSELAPGHVYEFRFAGVKGAEDLPAISAKVIRQEKGTELTSRLHFYSMEFVGVQKEQMEETLKRIVPSS